MTTKLKEYLKHTTFNTKDLKSLNITALNHLFFKKTNTINVFTWVCNCVKPHLEVNQPNFYQIIFG